MDNIKETSESFTKINLNKEKSQTRSPQNEEDYFRGSTSNENDSEFQMLIKNDTIYAIKIIEKEFIEKVNLVFTRGK